MKYFAAQLLAGCIIINPVNKQAVIANTVEIYGRTKTVDHHREHFGLMKGKPISTSLPPEKSLYPNVIVKIHHDQDGGKLTVGTQTLNALITSSIRIDKQVDPCVGAKIDSFEICETQGAEVRIFLDNHAIDKANALLKSTQNYLESFHLAYQLRQLRSKFHRQSTYYLIRCNSPMLSNHQYFPYTIFTVCDTDGSEESDTSRISSFFKSIAMGTLKHKTPKIKKETVVTLSNSCK